MTGSHGPRCRSRSAARRPRASPLHRRVRTSALPSIQRAHHKQTPATSHRLQGVRNSARGSTTAGRTAAGQSRRAGERSIGSSVIRVALRTGSRRRYSRTGAGRAGMRRAALAVTAAHHVPSRGDPATDVPPKASARCAAAGCSRGRGSERLDASLSAARDRMLVSARRRILPRRQRRPADVPAHPEARLRLARPAAARRGAGPHGVC